MPATLTPADPADLWHDPKRILDTELSVVGGKEWVALQSLDAGNRKHQLTPDGETRYP